MGHYSGEEQEGHDVPESRTVSGVKDNLRSKERNMS